MNSKKHKAALNISVAVGLIVFFICVGLAFVTGLAAAFLGSERAAALFVVVVEFPSRALHLPHFNGAFYAAMVWAILAMIITYIRVISRSARGEEKRTDENPDSGNAV